MKQLLNLRQKLEPDYVLNTQSGHSIKKKNVGICNKMKFLQNPAKEAIGESSTYRIILQRIVSTTIGYIVHRVFPFALVISNIDFNDAPRRKGIIAMRRMLRKLSVFLIFSLIAAQMSAEPIKNEYTGYTSLDKTEPITFDGMSVVWQGKSFTLDENTIFLDYRLEESQISHNPYAFNNINDAAAALKDGTENKPMMLLTAPGVYWVDDPDDPEIRVPKPGEYFPLGMKIRCDHLYFYGLNNDPDNVVFAVNRGQTQGASGNFTMFSIEGKGLRSENVTFGNYCNVDLEFFLAPELSRKKRAEAIAQAQLFMYRSKDGVAINTNFISRLNLLPFAMTYLNCHLESSGHASFFNSVYIGCSIDLYSLNFASGKFFDCDIYLMPFSNNYKDKEKYRFGLLDGQGNGLVCVDTRFHRSKDLVDAGIPAEISWDRVPQTQTTRSYQHNVTLDGKPYVIQEYATPGATVVIPDGSDLLKAYKLIYNGKTYYNVPNILSGFDPFNYTDTIKAAAVADGNPENSYLNIPMTVSLLLAPKSNIRDNVLPDKAVVDGNSGNSNLDIPKTLSLLMKLKSKITIRSTQTEAVLHYNVLPAGYENSTALGEWLFRTKDSSKSQYVRISDNKNGTITVSGTNKTKEAIDVIIVARNTLGIEAAIELTIEPPYIDAPKLVREPVITKPENGSVKLDYELILDGMKDESLITWYRCKDANDSNPLKLSVTRLNNPESAYTLSGGDVGYYLKAVIQPNHMRCDPGNPKTVYSSFKVATEDVKVNRINTDFHNLPTDPQPMILPGTWTLDGYFAPECYDDEMNPPKPRYEPDPDSWKFSLGQNGAEEYMGLEQSHMGARLFYMPVGNDFGNMTLKAFFAPKKTSGAGFGSATDQFMDVFIKFDLASMSGYALRIERLSTLDVTKLGFNGDGAVAGCAFSLIRYINGKTIRMTRGVMSSAFLTECLVEMKVVEGKLFASVISNRKNRNGDMYDYLREVHLDAEINENGFGGTGMLFTGGAGVNAVKVLRWDTQWE